MPSNQIARLAIALALAAGSVTAAGCGGGGARSQAAESRPTAHDCSMLGHVADDLAFVDAAGTGFDYRRDRDFIDGYVNRAPRGVAGAVGQLRGIVDAFASAAAKIGLAPGEDPRPDQIDQLRNGFHVSSSDQEANGQAVTDINLWVLNGCAA